jgi:hypothetical protein
MSFNHPVHRHSRFTLVLQTALTACVLVAVACAPSTYQSTAGNPTSVSRSSIPDPRVGLRGGAYDAAEAIWNFAVL